MERPMQKGRAVIATCESIKGDDNTYIDLMDEIAVLFAPEQETLLEVSEGSEILQPIISTGILANQLLQGGLYSNSMAMGKGNIADADDQIMKLPMVREWYATLSKQTHHHIGQSKFAQAFANWLTDYVPFGGGVMYIQWNPTTLRHEYKVFPIGKCHYLYDADGNVCELYREYTYTADQAVEKFGYSDCPKVVQVAWDKTDSKTKFDFIHCVKKNRKYDPESASKHWSKMQYISMHVHVTTGKVCRESGSRHMRYVVEHFYTKHGERNGRSPAMQALPVMRTLMKTVSDFIDGTELAIGPPMWLPDRDAVENAELESFGVNYADLSKGDPWMYKTDSGALQISADFISWLRDEIDKLFFIDLFNMLEHAKAGAKTAYEVSQLVAERTQAIAPIANSLGNFFRRVYKLVASDLIDSGQVDAPPTEVNIDDLQVTYTSRLDVRLREIENVSMQEAVAQALKLTGSIQESPQLQAVIKVIPALIAIFESHNVDPDIIRNADDADEELNRLNQEAAQAQAVAQAGDMAGRIDPMKAAEAGSPVDQLIEDGAGGMISQ